jgi:hypothetical protein
MVRLEWAEIEAFDGAAEPVLSARDLLASGPDPHFHLQPYVRLLKLRYPVDDLLLALRKDDSEGAMTSNAVSQPRRGTRSRKVARQKEQTIYLAVHRIDYSVYFKRLEPEAFAFLIAIREGKSLSDAVVAALQRTEIAESKLLTIVQNWFENWSSLGWFCQPNSASREYISSSGIQS